MNKCRRELINRVRIDVTEQDIRKRFRKYGAKRCDFVKKYFCRVLRKVIEYPQLLKRLHPFERLSVECSLQKHYDEGGVPFGKLLGGMIQLRRRIAEEATMYSYNAAHAERGRLATLIADNGIQTLYEIIADHEPLFQQFLEAQRAVRRAPFVDLDRPMVAFVGGPNVGKSSLVKSISTGTPEVADYCYTTKELTLGHIWHFIAGTPLLIQGQVVDTPGLKCLPSDPEKMGILDELTMGALKELPTAVVFVFDPVPETSGFLLVEEQIELRDELRAKFPQRPWLDVVTKLDEEEGEEACDVLEAKYPEALFVSALSGVGLDLLNMEIRRLIEGMTKVVRQLQRAKLRQLRMGEREEQLGKEALSVRG